MKKILPLLLAIGLTSTSGAVIPPPEVDAPIYVLIDGGTGSVIAEKASDQPVPIASVTKIMTAYVVFKEIQHGTLALSDEVKISKSAYDRNGSTMFLEIGQRVTVEDLVKGLLSVSGNDAATALAEHISGDEERFAQLMNGYAKNIGMLDSNFINASGLDSSKGAGLSTAKDLSKVIYRLMNEFPDYYQYFSIKEFSFNGIAQKNRNALIHESNDYTGLKTGYTSRAKYCLAASYSKNDRDVAAVVLGAKTSTKRFNAARILMNYGYRRFANITPIDENRRILDLPVYFGDRDEVAVYPAESFSMTVPRELTGEVDNKHVKLEVSLIDNEYGFPYVSAPISSEPMVVGEIRVRYKGDLVKKVPLITKDAIESSGFIDKGFDFLSLKYKSVSKG